MNETKPLLNINIFNICCVRKKMKITISGYPGAGKGELIKALKDKYNLRFLSVGDLRGEMALDKGMTIEEFNKLGETGDTDTAADEYQTKWAEEHDEWVIEGRLSYHFAGQADDVLNIFLYVDSRVGAERIFEAQERGDKSRLDETVVGTKKEKLEKIIERNASDDKRFEMCYGKGLDYKNPNNYDFYIDTTELKSLETNTKVIEFIEKNYKAS